MRELRTRVTEAIEPLRRDKTIRSSLEAEITMPDIENVLGGVEQIDLSEIFISAKVHSVIGAEGIQVAKSDNHKCGRCWRLLPEVVEDGDLCNRCEDVVNA